MIKKWSKYNLIHIDTVEEVSCAGVLITRNILLTARSCVHRPGSTGLHNIKITVGFGTYKKQVNLLRLSFSFRGSITI